MFAMLCFPALASADQDADFLAARDAFRVGNAAKLNQFAARLQQSPLEPYVAYYQLRMRLETSNDAEVQAFLNRPDDTPLINRMRIEWLKMLGKKRRWITFAAHYPRLTSTESELVCYDLQARQYLQTVKTPPESEVQEVLGPPEPPPFAALSQLHFEGETKRPRANDNAWQLPTHRLFNPGLPVAGEDRPFSTARLELHEARKLWLTAKEEMPDSCTPLFNAAIANGIISEVDIAARVRLALESGNVSLARQLSIKLPLQRAISAAALQSAAADPERYLNRAKLSDATEPQRWVALFALQRLAKQLPQLALAQWEKNAEHFNAAERQYFFGWLGYEAARKHHPRALEWYMAAGDATLADMQLSWRVRAALRMQNWHEVWVSTGLMPVDQQQEGVWRYWKARALRELGQAAAAEDLLDELSRDYNYYGQLAAEELGASSASGIISARHQPSEAAVSTMQAQPAIQRVLALYRMDLRTDAAQEWAWVTRKMNDKELLVAAEIAYRNGMYDLTINTADRTLQLHDFNLRYPAPYRDQMQGYIRINDLEEAWVYGLMRQESRFVTQAKSQVGAAGIMQVMPATARWIAQKLGMKDYRKTLIHQLDTNLKLGTYYMKTVLSSLDNNPLLASVAYNAGPSRARKWRADNALEGTIYVETIPFDETRQYAKKVMSNTVYYSKLFGQPSRSLKSRLGIIAGTRDNAPENPPVLLPINPLGDAVVP